MRPIDELYNDIIREKREIEANENRANLDDIYAQLSGLKEAIEDLKLSVIKKEDE